MAIADSFVPNKENGAAISLPLQEITEDGAITIAAGSVPITKATAAAITIDDPPTTMDGAILVIVAGTAAAHVVDNSEGTGFNGTQDTATFGGAVGDTAILYAFGGVWHVIGNINVTLA